MQALPRDHCITPESATPGSPSHRLAPEQLAQLREATERSRRVRRAAGVAMFNTWAIGIFALPTVLFGLFHMPSLLIGAGLTIVAVNEYRGHKRMRQFDRGAPRFLGFNQLFFAAVLVLYGGWGLAGALFGPNHYDAQIAEMPSLAPTLEPLGELYQLIAVLTYSCIIVGSLIFQGLNAWYYFTRDRHLRDFLAQTPPWVLETHRAAA